MKKQTIRELVAGSLLAALMVGVVGCGGAKTADTAKEEPKAEEPKTEVVADAEPAAADVEEPEEEEPEDPYVVYTDASGNPVDLGGAHIIIRDWWSGEVGHEPAEPGNAYEEARQEYLDWAQEKYNFTIEQAGISSWESVPEDYVNYVSTQGDDNYYLFILRQCVELPAAINADLMYDLSTLDCLDFSDARWQDTKCHEMYSKGSSIYCMSGESVEPTMGIYFNKRLLKDAGVEPQTIYDLQESGEWTWAKFEEICKQIQADTDNDGTIDRYAMVNFASTFFDCAVMSNNAHYIGKDAAGNFTNNLETPETLEALNWAVDMLATYDFPQPADTEWNYWADSFLNGDGIFIAGFTYQAGQDWKDMEDDFGFVCFPKGPKASDYTNWITPNAFAIPACYSPEKAYAIAFAYGIWTDPIPGFEDYNGRIQGFYQNFRDTESVDLSVARMFKNASTTSHTIVPGVSLGPDLIWGMSRDNTPAQKVEAIKDTWDSYIAEANK